LKRREFLSSLAVAAAGTLPSLNAAAASIAPGRSVYRRVRPTDAAWPDAVSWSRLNDAIGGNLIKVQGLFQSCVSDPDSAACAQTRQNIGNPYWLGDQPGGTENSGWLDAWSPAPSAYAIKARHAGDVAAGITFARENRHGYDSLWLPAALLQAERRQSLADALFAASRHQMVRLHIGKGLAGAPSDVRAAVRQTATNPAVADAFTLVIIAEGERPPAYPGYARPAIDLAAARRNARDIGLAAAELRKLAPDSGSYVSESNYFNRNWQREYWGGNYARLRAIKSKYDPEGLFFVHHGVGSEDWSADGFTSLG
jgi:hypothetical protein